MTSQVDATFPADSVKVSKADFRANLLTIKNEITALQNRTSVAGAQAYYGFATVEDLVTCINTYSSRNGVAKDMAYGRVALTSL